MTLDVSNDWALRGWLLGFGAGVKVLSPTALAHTLRDELQRAREHYR
jgi:predicted DNA-binding transcriptional regulator YafY